MEIFDESNSVGEDYVLSGLGADGFVRILAAQTTNLVQKSADIHNTSALATAALGRTLTAGVLFAKQLKNQEDSVTIQIKGRGPLGGVVVVARPDGGVKGYIVNPDVELPLNSVGKLDVGGGIGKGFISIIKDMGMKEPYVGTSALVSGEIAEDIAQYLYQSEQVPSVVALGVRLVPYEGDPKDGKPFTVNRAGGYMLQLMPGADEKLIDKLETIIGSMPSVTTLLSAGATMENIIEDIFRFFGDFNVTKTPCNYSCTCSRERMRNALKMLKASDLEEIIADDKGANLKCDFCDNQFFFDTAELKAIFEEKNKK